MDKNQQKSRQLTSAEIAKLRVIYSLLENLELNKSLPNFENLEEKKNILLNYCSLVIETRNVTSDNLDFEIIINATNKLLDEIKFKG